MRREKARKKTKKNNSRKDVLQLKCTRMKGNNGGENGRCPGFVRASNTTTKDSLKKSELEETGKAIGTDDTQDGIKLIQNTSGHR